MPFNSGQSKSMAKGDPQDLSQNFRPIWCHQTGCLTQKIQLLPASMLGSSAKRSAVRSCPSGSVLTPPRQTRQSSMIFKSSSSAHQAGGWQLGRNFGHTARCEKHDANCDSASDTSSIPQRCGVLPDLVKLNLCWVSPGVGPISCFPKITSRYLTRNTQSYSINESEHRTTCHPRIPNFLPASVLLAYWLLFFASSAK